MTDSSLPADTDQVDDIDAKLIAEARRYLSVFDPEDLSTLSADTLVLRLTEALERRRSSPKDDSERERIDQRPNGCWAACIATITGIPLDELQQDFAADAGESWFDDHGTDLWNDMQRKLTARGWSLFHTYGRIPRGFAIAGGISPRGLYHAVVVKDGELWHDPHPSRAGLTRIDEYEFLMPIVGLSASHPSTPDGRDR